jgi:hypothetical protein
MNTRRLLLLFCPGFGFCIQLHATILNVPAQYPTIQAAMQAAVDGDTVLVAPGTYYGPVYFRGKKVVLASQYLLTNNISYIHSTIIDGSTPPNPDSSSCVFIVNNEDTNAVLVGFTLTRGKGTKWLDEHGAGLYREGGGILTQYSSPKIMHNIIVDNEAINASGVTSAGGGAIRVGDGNPRIINNIIMDNRGRYGAGIVLNYTGAIVKNNIIARNNGGQDFGGSGIWIYANGPAAKLVENNTIVGNSSSLDGGGVLVWNTSATLKNNIIWGNTAPQGPQIRLRPGGSVTVSYCDVQDGWTGTGNINVDPQFRDTSHYLQATSQCVDAGDTSAQYNDPEDPLDPGRALYPSLGGLRNDIGAYLVTLESGGRSESRKVMVLK